MRLVDTIHLVAVEVAGKRSRSKLLHREDCPHLRDASWPAERRLLALREVIGEVAGQRSRP
jgi:hypothetical protein